MILIIRFLLIYLSFNYHTFALDLPETAPQGSLIIGESSTADLILVDGESIKISPDGFYVFAISREQVEPVNITFIRNNEITDSEQIFIEEQDFDIQRIDGLPEQMVTPLGDDIIKRIITENNFIKDVKQIDLDLTFFKEKFVMPTDGIISGVFGSQRILNGIAKSPHRGIDIAAEKGSRVIACNDGIVIHAENDLYYTGGTIILDHGHGVKSIYAHLSSVDVVLNQQVSRNEIIGKVGSTGRSTGPHLHWGVMVFDTYVDPLLLKYN